VVDNDVQLRDLLDVPEPFRLQSPLPQLATIEQHRKRMPEHSFEMQHVKLNDILDAPSMDISLKTATELALED
jgi:hypothetical protein